MSKKSAKIAATYFITIIASLVVVGGVSYIFLGRYLRGENVQQTTAPMQTSVTVSRDEYVPTIDDAQTVLAVYDAGDKPSSVTFVLFRSMPESAKLYVIPLRSDIVTREGTSTIYDLYRSGGTQYVCRAVEGLIGYPVNKYVKVTDSSFGTFYNLCGSVTYNIPFNMIYESENSADNTVIKAGQQILDPRTMRKVLIYPNYPGGEEYRSGVVGELMCMMMNNGAKGTFATSLETVFDDLANSDAETDISRYDFMDMQPAIEYTVKNNSSPAQLVLPSGVSNDVGCVLDDAFLDALPAYFE